MSRDAVEEDDSDDPFARHFDDDDSDEEASANGMRYANDSNGDSDSDSDSMADEDESGLDGTSSDGVEQESDHSNGGTNLNGTGRGAQASDTDGDPDSATDSDNDDESAPLPSNMALSRIDEAKAITKRLATAAQSDVAKGEAIKRQRKMFDSLLNGRVRLQKAMISTNSMAADAHKDELAPRESIEAAEAAALTLLNNLTDLRATLDEARTGQKRKRTPYTLTTESSEIWASIQASEASSQNYRKAILEKWSTKTRAVKATSNDGRLNATAQQTLTDVLESQLANSTHLVARTQAPRSCAPLQAASSRVADPNIYDDADFYGLLLKELLDRRSADLSAQGTAEFVVQAPWQVSREAKTKRAVDTKASKGRRLRYTVHEKLQNFMAPEDRGGWEERQRDELFSSLFGQRLGLGEHDEGQSDQDDDDMDAEEQGLILFRS